MILKNGPAQFSDDDEGNIQKISRLEEYSLVTKVSFFLKIMFIVALVFPHKSSFILCVQMIIEMVKKWS